MDETTLTRQIRLEIEKMLDGGATSLSEIVAKISKDYKIPTSVTRRVAGKMVEHMKVKVGILTQRSSS